MYCKKCGARIRKENEFCPKCGAQQTHFAAQNSVVPDNTQNTVNNIVSTTGGTNETVSQTPTSGGGGKNQPAPANKSLIFVVLVVLAIGGYVLYNNYNNKDDDDLISGSGSVVVTDSGGESSSTTSDSNSGSSSVDTSSTQDGNTSRSTDDIEGCWWAEKVSVKGDLRQDWFLVVSGEAVAGGYITVDLSKTEVEVVDYHYDVEDLNTVDYAYDSSKDEIVLNKKVRFKRATDAQMKLIKVVMDSKDAGN